MRPQRTDRRLARRILTRLDDLDIHVLALATKDECKGTAARPT